MDGQCFFISDLHGHISRYGKLFDEIEKKTPDYVFFGGDLLPHGMKRLKDIDDFCNDFLFVKLKQLKNRLGILYPAIIIILGNDDYRSEEASFKDASNAGLFYYLNNSKILIKGLKIFGYPFVPPTPFQLKDWEKYDVSRYVDPGCIPPTEGIRSIDADYDTEYATICGDLENITRNEDLSRAIMLFHSPPYKSDLDRAPLDGMKIEHVPLDVHIGSIAIQRFIEAKQPFITLHGHAHESTRLTGNWKQQFSRTFSFNAAHEGTELCLIEFDIQKPSAAIRRLI